MVDWNNYSKVSVELNYQLLDSVAKAIAFFIVGIPRLILLAVRGLFSLFMKRIRVSVEKRRKTKDNEEKKPSNSTPLIRAEYLLHPFLDAKTREIVDGDLYERFSFELEKSDRFQASILFCKDVAKSLWPFLKHRTMKLIVKLLKISNS